MVKKHVPIPVEIREFYEIGKSLSSEKNTVKLFEKIITSSINLTSSDAGTIYLVVDKESEKWSSVKSGSYKDKYLKFIISKNMSMDIQLETSISSITPESLAGYTIITGKSLRVDDAYSLGPDSEYRHNKTFDLQTGYRTKSILTIPMKDHENNVTGVIQLINKKKDRNLKIDYKDPSSIENIIPYDHMDELIMDSLAGQAAVALENNLLYRDMQELLQNYIQKNNQLTVLTRKSLQAHEEERRRIAREIHDGPAQSTANLAFKVEICKKYLQKGNYEVLAHQLEDLEYDIRSTIQEIRTIIYDLKPSYLEDGLITALENRLSIFRETTGLNVSFKASGSDEKIEYYMASTLYRIVQEALNNISKHAEAKNVKIDFKIADEEIHLLICDDGKGFDLSKLSQRRQNYLKGGFGLEGIRERVELVRGTFIIESTPGKGTKIRVVIPIT